MKIFSRQILLFTSILIYLLVACQGTNIQVASTGGELTAQPTLPPSATPNPPIATPTSEPTPTHTSQPIPTATAIPTDTPTPTATIVPAFQHKEGFDFSKEDGLALRAGSGNAWDSFQAFMPDVFFHDGLFHMFYVGAPNAQEGSAIGYATSRHGLSFTKHIDNPVLVGTDAFPSLVAPELFFDGNQWVMFVNAGDAGIPIGDTILRATAPELSGPWTLSETPLMSNRGLRPWDRQSQPAAVLQTEDGLDMYYMGIGGIGFQMGLAHSTDGLNWTLHDDPETGDRFEGSDPILPVGPEGSWDSASAASLEVILNEGRYEMFYTGSTTDPFAVTTASIQIKKPTHIGYATSSNGVEWVKHEANPVITLQENCWPLLGSVLVDGTYFIYYDQNCGFKGIGVISGTLP